MAYYTRIFGKSNPDIHIDELIAALEKEGFAAKFAIPEDEDPDNWTMLEVLTKDEEVMLQIERNPIIIGASGYGELEEFKENIKNCRPKSAVSWLNSFFAKVEVIYAFQHLNSSFEEENFPIIFSLKSIIWHYIGGIFQADGEGFSNDDGYHILWQFAEGTSGNWAMAIREAEGKWKNFIMDLGNPQQREAFLRGEVPNGVKMI